MEIYDTMAAIRRSKMVWIIKNAPFPILLFIAACGRYREAGTINEEEADHSC